MNSNQLITKGYKNELAQMHKKGYGDTAGKWKYTVNELARVYQAKSILDYGCGQGVLINHVKKELSYRGYDPASVNKQFASAPCPADMVICIDVLEHIEPKLLDNVLNHLKALIKRVGFFVIAQRPASQILKNGRNAHLIQQGPEWWEERIRKIFNSNMFEYEINRQFGRCVKINLTFVIERFHRNEPIKTTSAI